MLQVAESPGSQTRRQMTDWATLGPPVTHTRLLPRRCYSGKEYGLQDILTVVIVPKIPETRIFHCGKNRLRHWFKEAATKGLAQCDRDERKYAQPSLCTKAGQTTVLAESSGKDPCYPEQECGEQDRSGSIFTKKKCEVLCTASENAAFETVSQKRQGLIAEGQETMNNPTSSDLNENITEEAGFEENSEVKNLPQRPLLPT